MNRFIFYITLTVTGLCMHTVNAQIANDSLLQKSVIISPEKQKTYDYFAHVQERDQELLKQEKENILAEEKDKLAIGVEKINALLQSGTISAEDAKLKKEELAKRAAQNIDSKTAIVENQFALIKRGEYYDYESNQASTIELGAGNSYNENGSVLLGFHYKSRNRKRSYDKRTYSDVVIAYGFTNTIRKSQSFGDSPYKFGRSNFFEFGLAFRTRILKNSNAVRLVYGLSFQFNNLHPKDNQYFVNNNSETSLEIFPSHLEKSKLRFDNIILPVHFEFGPSTKVTHKDYFRYNTLNRFKVGIGGFVGLNMGVTQKLKYTLEGEDIMRKTRQDFDSAKFLYGISSYVGFGAMSLYIKYDLNPMFRNVEYKQNAISAGLRIDL